MRVRLLRYMFAAIVAIAAVGCSNDFWDDRFGGEPQEVVCDAELTLSITTTAQATRAVPDAGTAAAGDKMNNLTMLLVRDDNTIEKRVDISTVASPTGFTSSDKTEATIKLTDVERGDHTIYLIANSPIDLSAYEEGVTVDAVLTEALLTELSGTDTPSFDESKGMPLTTIVPTTLKQGVNNVSAELERVVGRFGITFYNHVVDEKYTVVISLAELSAFNATHSYLFSHSNAVPTGNSYRKFYAAPSGPQRVSHSGDLTPIDTYLYETDEEATYQLGFAVGVFEGLADGVTPTATLVPSVNETNHNDIISSHQYLIYHPDQDRERYLYMNGNSLALDTSVPTTGYENYLWTFSAETAGKIRNVGTGRWISRTDATLGTTDSEASAETFVKGNQGTSLYLRSSYVTEEVVLFWTNTYYHFLQAPNNTTISLLRGGSNSTGTSESNALWTLREITNTPQWSGYGTATLTASVSHQGLLTYINDLGSPAPLTQIKRNENLQVGVNLFYNPQTGDFNFEVVPWTEVNGDATFD